MLKKLGRFRYWEILLAVFLVSFLGRTLYYYRGIYVPPLVPTDAPDALTARLQPSRGPTHETPSLSGLVIVDKAHQNNFKEDEFAMLSGRVTAAGGQVQYFDGGRSLEDALRGAQAFVVAVNGQDYSGEDALAVENFVRRGGRLLLIGDPTRMQVANKINSLAARFGILYQDDTIYNLVENDGSYLNVFLRDFADDPLADGVEEIVVRAAGSLETAGGVLLSGDANTYSSLRETPGGVVAMARTTEDKVLALTDLTFLTAPYNNFGDNDRFIDNLTVFLLSGERSYHLLDFPYLFKGPVDLVYTDSGLLEQTFDESVKLRQELNQGGAVVKLADSWSGREAAVIVGLFDQIDAQLLSTLASDGITPSATRVDIKDIGEFANFDSTFFHLHFSPTDGYQLFILADTAKSLKQGLEFLFGGNLGDCSLSDQTAMCFGKAPATATPTPNLTVTDATTLASMTPLETITVSATPMPQGTITATGTPTATPTSGG